MLWLLYHMSYLEPVERPFCWSGESFTVNKKKNPCFILSSHSAHSVQVIGNSFGFPCGGSQFHGEEVPTETIS